MAPTLTIDNVVDRAKTARDANSSDFSDVYKGIVQLQQQDRGNPTRFADDMKEFSRRLHEQKILPTIDFDGIDSNHHLLGAQNGKRIDVVAANVNDTFAPGKDTTFLQGVGNVASEIGNGALDELVHHPGRVAISAGIGLALGIGAAFVAPEVAIAVGAAGLAYGGYQLVKHIPGWVNDSIAVANPGQFSKTELSVATTGLNNVGAGAVDVGAGVAGGIAGGYIGSAIKVSMASGNIETPPVNDEQPPVANDGQQQTTLNDTAHHAHTQHGTIGSATTQVDDPTKGGAIPTDGGTSSAQAVPIGDPHHAAAASQVVTGNETDPNPTPIGVAADRVVPATEPKVTPVVEKVATPAAPAAAEVNAELEQSIAANQGLFRSANDRDAVITATKQAYNVMFEKVNESGLVPTLENPTGAPVEPGQWIATRLNADGSPVIERGMLNRWVVTEKTMLKTYQTTADELASTGKLIAATKTDSPPVPMIQLQHDFSIVTPWGKMSGQAGDWLANYNYDSVAGEPGNDFAIVTAKSFNQTYQAVPKGNSV